MRILLRSARVLAVAFMLITALAACGDATDEPLQIESVTFMRDDGSGKAGATVTSFNPSDHIIHAKANLNQTATDFNGKIAWVAVETEAGNDIAIAETNVSGLAANTISSKLELPQLWPIGKYRVDFFQGDVLLGSGEFTVQP